MLTQLETTLRGKLGKIERGSQMFSGETVTSIQSETLAYWMDEVQKPEIIGIAKG